MKTGEIPATTAIVIPNTAKIITLINQAVIAFAKRYLKPLQVNIDSQTKSLPSRENDVVAITLLPIKNKEAQRPTPIASPADFGLSIYP